MKKNLFDSNKVSLNQINICSNQINFCLKSNKLYLWPYIIALISLFWRKINLIQTNIYLFQRYLVWIKQILFHLNKHLFKSKQVFQTNHFLWFNQIFFLSVRNKNILYICFGKNFPIKVLAQSSLEWYIQKYHYIL